MSYAYQSKTVPRHPVRLVLPAVVALAVLAACSETTKEIPLATLVAQQAEYNGQTLSATGIVRTFEEPRHYWIEDDDLNRVAIEPDEAVSNYVGERVRVTGNYRADRETGRILMATEVIVLDYEPN
ncbi:MAG: glucose-inhibited division protein B [Saccharospirillum sp.]|nr:glucose-inhibited division protein B [Saccharospirillum sp.]